MEIKVFKKGDKSFMINTEKTYQIVSKYDADAPDGFKKENTTKTLDPLAGVTSAVVVSYDGSKGMYDTGLSEASDALRKLYPDPTERAKALKVIQEHIQKPLLNVYTEEQLDPRNFEFWDEFSYKYSLDSLLDPKKPKDRFILYSSILHGKLAPSEFSSDPHFKLTAQFAVECKDYLVDTITQRELDNSKARAKFFTLLEDDKKSLVNLLDWIGIRGVDKADNGLLNSVFVNWLSVDERQNTKQFLEVYEEYYKSSAGQKVVEVYNHLKNLTKQNKVVVSKEGVTLGDTILEEAKDLKQAAKLIAKNKTHLATLSQLIEAK
jgi:hypothetical protein